MSDVQTDTVMSSEDLTKLAFLAQAIVADPNRFDEFVHLVETGYLDAAPPSPALVEAIAALRAIWARFDGHVPTPVEIAERALDYEGENNGPRRLAAIALTWAVENTVWRSGTGRALARDETDLLSKILKRTKAAPGF